MHIYYIVIVINTKPYNYVKIYLYKQMKNVLILLLAGQGSRIQEQIHMKKQFYKVNSKELFLYAFDSFLACGRIDTFVLVIDENDQKKVMDILHQYPKYNSVNLFLVFGGKTRSESVRNALFFLSETADLNSDDKVIIHDADRPLIKQEDISFYLEESQNVEAATPVVKINDSLMENTNRGFVYRSRDYKFLVQTPQIFSFGPLLNLYENHFVNNETDDFRKALENGLANKVVTGNPLTFKVTTYQDLIFFKDIVENKGGIKDD